MSSEEATPQPENMHPADDEPSSGVHEALKNFSRDRFFPQATDEQLDKIIDAVLPYVYSAAERPGIDWDQTMRDRESVSGVIASILQPEDSAPADEPGEIPGEV